MSILNSKIFRNKYLSKSKIVNLKKSYALLTILSQLKAILSLKVSFLSVVYRESEGAECLKRDYLDCLLR